MIKNPKSNHKKQSNFKQQRERPLTTQKRFQKYSTQPSIYRSNHISSCNLPDDILIERLKTVLPQQNTAITNSQNCRANSENNSNDINLTKQAMNKTVLLSSFHFQEFNKITQPRFNPQENFMENKRGLNGERVYYKKMLSQINQIDQVIPNLAGLTFTQIFELKQKYLYQNLYGFFQKIGEQCYQKSLYIEKLWLSLKEIFENLIQRLILQLKTNQKTHLQESQVTHSKYQQKFSQFQNKLLQKDKQINKFKQIISKLSMKNWKKSKKNKQYVQGIIEIENKLTIVQKQRDQLQSQYVNLLTLGYEGGMDYDQAKKITKNKFRFQKYDQQIKSNQKRQNKCVKMDSLTKKIQKQNQIANESQIKNQDIKEQNNPKKKLFNIKQKYINGSKNLVNEPCQVSSDEQIYYDLWFKNFSHGIAKNNSFQRGDIINNRNSYKFEEGRQENHKEKQSKSYINRRVQTTQCIGIGHSLKVQKQCGETNLGIIQKYRDNLIKNKQVQTQQFKVKIPRQYNYGSQYKQQDFLDSLLLLDQTKQQNRSQDSFKMISQIYKPQEYSIKWMRIQRQRTQQQKNERRYDIEVQNKQTKDKLEIKQGHQNKQNISGQQNIQQEQQKRTEEKKIRRFNNRIPARSPIPKKNHRPSIFKRNSMAIGLQKRKSFKIQQIYQINNKVKKEKFYTKSNFIQEQQSQICSNNQITNSQTKKTKYHKSPTLQSEINIPKSQLQLQPEQQQVQIQRQSDYYTTDMLSVMQNMSKLTPKGIYIDQTMLFLLKKSLFKIKHDTCDNVFNQNYQFIIKVRQSVAAIKSSSNNGNNKTTIHNISVKNLVKVIGSVYDAALINLQRKSRMINGQSQQNTGNSILQKQKKLTRKDSIRSSMTKSHKRTQSNISNSGLSLCLQSTPTQQQVNINLISLLRQTIKKQYPIYKTQQIQNKIITLLKNVSYDTSTNYQLKNFILLSCLEDNIFCPVIFDNDVEFYFSLLVQLNIGNFYDQTTQQKQKEMQIPQKYYKLSNSNGSYQNCYTNIKKLRQCLSTIIRKYYKKQSLVTFIQHRINDTLQKIKPKQSTQMPLTTRLDIFKCSQLIMQSLFSFKLDILKSFAQLTQLPSVSPNNQINQQLFMDIVGFIKMTKLQKLNTVNKFRYDYGKSSTIQGINLINMVNFCIKHNIQDFDEVLYDVIRKYPISHQIQKKIINLQQNYPKFPKIQNICLYLYRKNQCYINQTPNTTTTAPKPKNLQIEQYPTVEVDIFTSQGDTVIGSPLSCIGSGLDKQLWQIIGVKASNSLIHCKVVELEASELLEDILGQDMIAIYMLGLCQLEQKKYQTNTIKAKLKNAASY